MVEYPEDGNLSRMQGDFTREDLIAISNEMLDTMRDLITDLPDSYVTFEPDDPNANDPYAADEADVDLAWTLGHVVLHATASGEENTARGAALARGVEVDWRSRYETPWQEVSTIQELLDRIEESRRIRTAYLNAWPDEPHYEVLWKKSERWGDLDARGMVLVGLRHDQNHLPQIEEIIRQAKEAMPAG